MHDNQILNSRGVGTGTGIYAMTIEYKPSYKREGLKLDFWYPLAIQ